MRTKQLFKSLLAIAAFAVGGVSQAWAQTTRTWDFTDNTKWSTIAASTGTVYYATDGTASTSTAFEASTAVCMQVTNEFTYNKENWYDIGNGATTSFTDGAPNKNFVSIMVPAGYTLTVNGCIAGGGTGNSNQIVVRAGEIETYYSEFSFRDIVYANNTEAVVTAYIYDPTTTSNRYMRIKTITLTSGIESLTAIATNTFWDFTNRAYTFKYGGATYDNIYFGNRVNQISNSQIDFGVTGNTTTGAGTVQIKIPANKAIGLLFKMGGSDGRKSYVSDGTNTLATIKASNGGKDVTVSIASSESERTLYFYNSSYNASYAYLKYLYVYTQQSVSIGSTGWATLYTPCALDFSGVSGLSAYTATCSESTVTLTEVSNVPAGTGVVLKGAPNTNYDIPVAGSSSTAKGHLTGAFLTATAYDAYSATDPAYTIYALTPVNAGATVQFNPVTSGSIAAGKAFLKVNNGTSSLARSMNVVFADETTGISSMNNTCLTHNEVYNLRGQRVEKPAKGLYIVNGKKVIIK